MEDYNIFKPKGVIRGGYIVQRRHYLFPIKTFRKLEVDPLETLTNSLAKVAAGDGAAVQYVCRSAKGSWRKKGSRVAVEMQKGKSAREAIGGVSFWSGIAAFFKTESKSKKDQPARTLSSGEQEAQKSIQDKAEQAGLDVNIRILACSDTAERAESYVRDIMNAYNQYNIYELGNVLDKALPSFRRWMIRDFIYRSFKERWGGIYAASEMASFYHFPLPTTETPNIQWLTARTAPPPVNMPEEGLILGKTLYRGVEALVRIKQADRRRHVYIVGKSGSGKSVLLANMARQDIENGHGVAVIDPHGDLIEVILEAIPKERIDDVIYLTLPISTVRWGSTCLKSNAGNKRFCGAGDDLDFYKLFPEMIGPMFEHNMRNVMFTLMADPEAAGTIAEIPRMFSDAEFQKMGGQAERSCCAGVLGKEMAKTSDFHKSNVGVSHFQGGPFCGK